MCDLTTWVYDSHVTRYLRPRQLTTHFHLGAPDGSGRSACVALFKHLKHFGVDWDTSTVCEWATRRGWIAKDVDLLREYSDGVKAGARYHTVPQPWAGGLVDSWLRGEPAITTKRLNRSLKIKSCCRGRAKRQTRSNGRQPSSFVRYSSE